MKRKQALENPVLQARPTINPYRHALYELGSRLLWDIKPASWQSRWRLRAVKDRFIGRKAVILCNGPSLLKSDLSLLDGVFTLGLNKINLLFERSLFRPSCIVAVNRFVLEQNVDFYKQTHLPLFLDSAGTDIIGARKNIVFLHSSRQRKFARDCSMSIYQGATVTFVALQLAFHLGFQQVALIGCDHNFSAKGTPHKVVVSGDHDTDHFDPNYFAGGMRWQLPDLVESEASYALARETFQAAGRQVINCTEGGQLEVFPRMTLAEFVGM